MIFFANFTLPIYLRPVKTAKFNQYQINLIKAELSSNLEVLTFSGSSTKLHHYFPSLLRYRFYLPYKYPVKTDTFFFFFQFPAIRNPLKTFRKRIVFDNVADKSKAMIGNNKSYTNIEKVNAFDCFYICKGCFWHWKL